MKTLSIRQPWAALIAYGIKPIENRGWQTGYRGPLLLHAAKTRDEPARPLYERLRRTHAALPVWDELPTGGIVGIATVVDCVRESPSRWFSGPVGWVLTDARLLPFVPARGQLWLFDLDEALVMHATSHPTDSELVRTPLPAPHSETLR